MRGDRLDFGGSLLSRALDHLGHTIVSTDAKKADFPTESQLCEIHGVSRSVIREAVKMLGAKGMLGGRPWHGTFVQPIESWNLFDTDVLRWLGDVRDPRTLLHQLSELRIIVEPQAAAAAATRATTAQLTEIEACLQSIADGDDRMIATPQPRAAFHTAVLRASGNLFFAQLASIATTALRAEARASARRADFSTRVDDYAKVYDALLKRQPSAAGEAMRALIERPLSA